MPLAKRNVVVWLKTETSQISNFSFKEINQFSINCESYLLPFNTNIVMLQTISVVFQYVLSAFVTRSQVCSSLRHNYFLPRFNYANKWYKDPQTIEKYKIEPEIQRMPNRTMGEAIKHFNCKVQHITIQLTYTKHQLCNITIRRFLHKSICYKKCKWTINKCCNTFHADNETVAAAHTPKTKRPNLTNHYTHHSLP